MRWLFLLAAAVAAWAQGAGDEAMRAAAEKQRSAAAVQRQAGRKQAESAGARLPEWSGVVAPEPACEPMEEAALAPLIERAAQSNGVDRELLRAVIAQESGFRPCAVSPKGAEGLMQLMPATAAELAAGDTLDPRSNIEAGARYLKQLLDRYGGDVFRALSAYNAGPRTVDEAGGIPDILETRTYLTGIFERLAK
jgi:soluble lytic murein transglycosylase-like protein